MKESMLIAPNEAVSGKAVVTKNAILYGSFPRCSVMNNGPSGLVELEGWALQFE